MVSVAYLEADEEADPKAQEDLPLRVSGFGNRQENGKL